MSNYLIKIGNLYYAGTKDYKAEQGYLEQTAPARVNQIKQIRF